MVFSFFRPARFLGCQAWFFARLLRNFTSRFDDDGALAFAGIIFTAAVVAFASADDGAPLPPIAVGASCLY